MLDSVEIAPIRQLWRAVLIQALRDACRGETPLIRDRAIKWLVDAGEDMRETCYLAGINWRKAQRLGERPEELQAVMPTRSQQAAGRRVN